MSSIEMIRTLAATSIGTTRLTRMVSKDLNKKFVLSLLELVNDSVVEGVLVLLKPSTDVVADLFHGNLKKLASDSRDDGSPKDDDDEVVCVLDTYVTGIMSNGEVSGLATGLGGLRLQVRGRLAQVVVVQLLNEGLIGGFGEHRLFLKDGEDTHGL